MGGHGGLNILPQKRWNVYNFDNREKVKQDEEAAAKEEQLKREQSRKRDAEFRLEQLRTARGLAPLHRPGSSQAGQDANSQEAEPRSESMPESELQPESRSLSNHINLFEGIKIFDPVSGGGEGKRKRKSEEEEKGGASKKMKKKEDPPRTVGPEDEKYRLGYGIAGKGVKLPWYMSKPSDNDSKSDRNNSDGRSRTVKEKSKSSGRKTLEELREERWRREKKEKERERALIVEKRSSRRDGRSGSNKSDYSRRKPSY